MGKWVTVLVILLIGYVIGVKFPQYGSRFGL